MSNAILIVYYNYIPQLYPPLIAKLFDNSELGSAEKYLKYACIPIGLHYFR